jgi:hypothetical protein
MLATFARSKLNEQNEWFTCRPLEPVSPQIRSSLMSTGPVLVLADYFQVARDPGGIRQLKLPSPNRVP